MEPALAVIDARGQQNMTHDYPKTIKEAEQKRYGVWAGNPRGYRYRPDNCAAEVLPSGTWVYHQCSRRPGHGPGHLYCKQHAAKIK